MTPYKSRKYLHQVMDYSGYEFRSPIDAWNPENNQKYTHDIEKIKYLEFDVLEGFTLYIPPYWWYSIKYSSADTIVLGATYNSIPRVLANSWDIIQYYLQQDNTTTKIARTIQMPVQEEDHVEQDQPLQEEQQESIIDPLKYIE